MRIFVSAGDFSGDIHAADLIRAIRENETGCAVAALGGKQLSAVSDQFLGNLVSLSGFGFWAPVRLYFRLRAIFNGVLKPYWDKARPDKVILVDYYGFNIHIAEEAHRRGIPVYYYISPQVWASRPGRIRKLARYVRKMIVILPFEEDLYRKSGVNVVFVGNPLVDRVPEIAGKKAAGDRPVIGLFPGSRPSVFDKHMPLLLAAAERIGKEIPAEFKIVCVESLRERCRTSPYEVVTETDFTARAGFTLAVTTSGTVSVENALLGIPMIVFYRLSRFNYWLAKMLVRIPYITMVNILAKREVVPELIQDAATPENIARRVVQLLRDPAAAQQMREQLASVRKLLGEPGASRRAAASILKD
jgi:lipid-A-disaccharide synthase